MRKEVVFGATSLVDFSGQDQRPFRELYRVITNTCFLLADTERVPFISIMRIALGPLLLLQGRQVRRTAIRLPEAAGPRHGRILLEGTNRELKLLFVGDSTMAGVGVTCQEMALASQTAVEVSGLLSRPVRWQIIAKSGVKTDQILALVAKEELLDADVLITALGVNDVLAQTEPRDFVRAYETLIAALLPAGRVRIAIISGLPPLHITPAFPQPLRWFLGIYARRLDRFLLRWIRGHHGVSYISLQWATDRKRLATDRFHPGEGLYQDWAHQIAQQIAHEFSAASIA
jgi:lysophospholipase L1-like esterase